MAGDDSASIDAWKDLDRKCVRVTCPTCDHVELVPGKPGEVEDHVECWHCLRDRMADEP
jgi:hypothetical protein